MVNCWMLFSRLSADRLRVAHPVGGHQVEQQAAAAPQALRGHDAERQPRSRTQVHLARGGAAARAITSSRMSLSIWGKMEKPLRSPAVRRCSCVRGTAKVTRPNGQMEMYGSPQRKDSSTARAPVVAAESHPTRRMGEAGAHGTGPQPPDLPPCRSSTNTRGRPVDARYSRRLPQPHASRSRVRPPVSVRHSRILQKKSSIVQDPPLGGVPCGLQFRESRRNVMATLQELSEAIQKGNAPKAKELTTAPARREDAARATC